MAVERNPRGSYLAVARVLRARIVTQGQAMKFPSFAEIGEEFGVSRSVVVRAGKVLLEQALVAAVPGGCYRVIFGGPAPDARPLDERIADVIEERGLLEGDEFASSLELCDRFGVSRPTVRKALDRLHAQGVLSEGGRGKVRVVRAAGSCGVIPAGRPRGRSGPRTHEQASPGRAQ